MSDWPAGRGERGALAFVQELKIVDAERAKQVAAWLYSEDVQCTSVGTLAQFEISLFQGSCVPLALRSALINAAKAHVGALSGGGQLQSPRVLMLPIP